MTRREIAKRLLQLGFESEAKFILASAPIQVTDIEFVDGQFPEDDFDPNAIATMYATFIISGPALVSLTGKQTRVLPKYLETLSEKDAIRLLGQGKKIEKDILKAIFEKANRAITYQAMEDFNRDITNLKIDWSDTTEFWTATINPEQESIEYTVEIACLFDWGKEQ